MNMQMNETGSEGESPRSVNFELCGTGAQKQAQLGTRSQQTADPASCIVDGPE